MIDTTIQVTSDYFCAGLLCSEGVVVEAAPILRYMTHWTVDDVKRYCKKKHWSYRLTGD